MKNKAVAFTAVAILSTAYAGSADAAETGTYIIKKGDTLSSIATKHKTTVAAIKQLNSLKSDLIYPNQTLKLPGKSAAKPVVAPKPAEPSKETLKQPAPAKITSTVYKVVPGDTLSKIAVKHKIKLADLLSWNQLSGSVIYPNQLLKIEKPTNKQPASAPAKPAPPKPKPKPTPAPAPSASYMVKSGDTLGAIALKHKTTVAEIKKVNRLSSDVIFAGQTLVLSKGKEEAKLPDKYKPVDSKPAKGPSKIGQPGFVDELIKISKSLTGISYKFGGNTIDGFDCSGYINYVFNAAGHPTTRLSAEGYYNRSYYVDKPAVGDLVFFENTYKKGISHVGIYLGNNEFISADNGGVRVVSLDNSYYKKHFESFKRFY